MNKKAKVTNVEKSEVTKAKVKKGKWTVMIFRASGKKVKLPFGNHAFSSLTAQASFLAIKEEVDKLQGSSFDPRMGILGMKIDRVKELLLLDAEGGRQDCAEWEA